MAEPVNPVDVERAIRDVVNEIGLGVRTVSNALEAYRAAERAYDRAFAREYMAFSGPAHERKYAAELATQDEREARDVAEVAWRYAERVAKSQENELSGWQTIAKSIIAMFGAAGTGTR